ncbi:MAG: GNAT family N-acetyltransferase [Promethearchaeota archaeon Loki_b31]|nr:MAG: GNAT family N-acetyltransferase [Candidatus Lokiarchaeota archaeon Loki_b31]
MKNIAKIIDINEENIDELELFCKKTKKKLVGYQNKVKWIKERFKEGLKYKLLIVKEGNKETSRGMIEYIPGEYNWRGIQANGWMVIHCLWVVGKHKKKGYGSNLLQESIKDAKKAGMHGVVGMSADKGGWLPKTKIYLNNGFEKVDEIKPYFGLFAIIFNDKAPKPKFYPISDKKVEEYRKGVHFLYSDQCPYIVDLVDELEKEFNTKNESLNAIKLKNCREAQQNGVHPYGTYCIACNGEITLYKHTTKKEILTFLNKIRVER